MHVNACSVKGIEMSNAKRDAKQRKEMDAWLVRLAPDLRASLDASYKLLENAEEAIQDGAEEAKFDAEEDDLIKTAKEAAQARAKGKPYVVDRGDQMEAVTVQKPLGALKYRGHSFTIWAMMDPKGGIANGGDTRQLKQLTEMNGYGAAAVRTADHMNAIENGWRQRVKEVQTLAAQGATDIKEVEAALPAMRKARANDPHGDMFEGVQPYVKAMRDAEAAIKRLRQAEDGLQKAVKELRASDAFKNANKAENKAQDLKGEIAAKEAEMKEARAIIDSVIGIAENILKQEWSALAAKALNYVTDKVIDSAIEVTIGKELPQLRIQLAAAEADIRKHTAEAWAATVDAARIGVDEAMNGLEAANIEFNNALEQIKDTQTAAKDALNKSPSTGKLAAMLKMRGQQISAAAAARSACQLYAREAPIRLQGMKQLANKLSQVGSFLDEAAKFDPSYGRETDYSKLLYKVALSNSVELTKWSDWIGSIDAECKKMIAWLGDGSKNGPMAPFDRANDVVAQVVRDN